MPKATQFELGLIGSLPVARAVDAPTHILPSNYPSVPPRASEPAL
ncbi:MAG: hypothetical protein CALGDGBN_00487 [Pseudomonadales bacterium]|nr:hypothetical protein [Pseudomonadales bacterium]